MNQQGIHVAPGEPSAKFDFLKVSNFLCEFRTEVDKARARFNLGIPDEYNFNWGNIKGTVTDQQDLVNVLNQQKNDYTAKYQDALSRISGINDSINTINQSLLTIRNVIDNSNLSTLEQTIASLQTSFADYQQRLYNLTINVAQNSTDIAELSRNQGGSGSSSLVNTVNDLVTRVQNLENSSGQGGGSTNYESRIAALENAIKINSLNTTLTISGIVNNSYVAVKDVTQPLSVRVLAEYSNLTGYKDVTEIATCSTQNSNVAYWDDANNRIVFGSTVGTTTLTFSFLTATAQVEVTVSETGEVTPEYEQYVGYGASYTDVVGSTACKRSSAAGTFNGSPIARVDSIYGLWACIEVGSETISATEQGYAVTLEQPIQHSYGGKTYNCYLIGVVTDSEIENIEFIINV